MPKEKYQVLIWGESSKIWTTYAWEMKFKKAAKHAKKLVKEGFVVQVIPMGQDY